MIITTLFKIIMVPFWTIGAIFLIASLISMFICALVAELESFLLKVFKLKKQRGKFYKAFMSLWGE